MTCGQIFATFTFLWTRTRVLSCVRVFAALWPVAPASSVGGTFQANTLEWVPFPFVCSLTVGVSHDSTHNLLFTTYSVPYYPLSISAHLYLMIVKTVYPRPLFWTPHNIFLSISHAFRITKSKKWAHHSLFHLHKFHLSSKLLNKFNSVEQNVAFWYKAIIWYLYKV